MGKWWLIVIGWSFRFVETQVAIAAELQIGTHSVRGAERRGRRAQFFQLLSRWKVIELHFLVWQVEA